tara:strand:- start:2458 stop:4230 length:1773 start_codon:yes stop_codon:yes gene_type:complete
MADFGLYQSMRGFLGTGERKLRQAEQEANALRQEEQLMQQREQINLQYAKQYEDYVGSVNELVDGMTVQGKEAIQEKANTLQLEMREDLARYNNNYSRWLSRGGYGKLNQYKQAIIGSQEYKNHSISKANLTKIKEAQDEGLGHLIPKSTLNSLVDYKNGETDLIQYNGLLGEVDTKEIIKSVEMGRELTGEEIMSGNNAAIILNNYMLENGYSRKSLDEMTPEQRMRFQTTLYKYAYDNYGGIRGIADPKKMTGSTSMSPSQHLNLAIANMPTVKAGYDIYNDLETNQGVAILSKTLGLDPSNQTSYNDGSWFSETSRVQGYGIAPSLHESFYKSTFGGKYARSLASSDNPGVMQVSGVNLQGMYTQDGTKVQEGGMITGTPTGVFLSYKTDNITNGDYTGPALLVDYPDMSDSEKAEYNNAMQDVNYKPTMVIQIEGEDGEYYYKEIQQNAITAALRDKELDIEDELSTVTSTQKRQSDDRSKVQITRLNLANEFSQTYDMEYGMIEMPKIMHQQLKAIQVMYSEKNGIGKGSELAHTAIRNMVRNQELLSIMKSGNLDAFYKYIAKNSGQATANKIKEIYSTISPSF